MSGSWPVVWGSPQWLGVALGAAGAAAAVLAWNYGTARANRGVRAAGALLKAVGFAALVLALVEPLLTGTRPRKGANAFVVLADNSQSLRVRDTASGPSRADWARELLRKDAPWTARLGQDFDLRRYAFDTHVRAVDGFDGLAFDGNGTALPTALQSLARRFRGLPLAGVLVVTDGNRTDAGDVNWAGLPPVYPVAPASRGAVRDIGVRRVTVSQTNFEAAPVVLQAEVAATGFVGKNVVVSVADEAGKEVESQEVRVAADDRPFTARFQFRPVSKGVGVYRVTARATEDDAAAILKDGAVSTAGEQTLANNTRLAVVDQGSGPYRVLYVSGRPNWEFKFIRRALAEDEQVELVGLIRIAKRQPKFDFRSPRDRSNSELYKGFENPDGDTAERADQPVLVRLGTRDEAELRDGFPKTAEELFTYHAIVVDDVESAFFTQDQLALLRTFVSQRGGGVLMLGGLDSFAEGQYDRTPVGELLPVYLSAAARGAAATVAVDQADAAAYRLVLTREGWLQPWVRTRRTEDDERKRLGVMPPFETVSRVAGVKPGAAVLAEVTDESGKVLPALVAQSFGKGRVAALTVGDLWRWGIRREQPDASDLERSWRQTVRWLVADVPSRVDLTARAREGTAAPAVEVTARVRDAEYRPLDNAKVAVKVNRPGGDALTLDATPDPREPGAYVATYVTRQPGAYRFTATATAPDGSAVGEREVGWAAQPAADEFARLEPDHAFLKELAEKTGGEVVDSAQVDRFVATLPNRGAPVTEPWTAPLWHQPWYFLLALTCLTAEWGLRRFNGLA